MPDTRPGLSRTILRTANRVRARGPAEVAGLARDRVLEAHASRETLYLFRRAAGPLDRPGEGLTFRRATTDDALRYASDVGTDSPRTFRGRLGPDVTCYVVEMDDRLVHATWVTTTKAWTREIRGYLSPPEGDAYVYESFTRADARGRGIYPFALAGIVTDLGRAGIDTVWVGVEAKNLPSQRAITKAGFEKAFELHYRRRWGRFTLEQPQTDEGREFLRALH